MVRYENDCCNCAVPGYPCDHSHEHVPHYYCDNCGCESYDEDGLYHIDGMDLCWSCAWDNYPEEMEDEYGEM